MKCPKCNTKMKELHPFLHHVKCESCEYEEEDIFVRNEGKHIDNQFNRLYEELTAIVGELRPYYDIDKVKPYSVYVWSKGKENDFGKNVFDIESNEIVFYDKTHKIPEDALPIINKIQSKLKEIKNI